jgi:hypothetical protein
MDRGGAAQQRIVIVMGRLRVRFQPIIEDLEERRLLFKGAAGQLIDQYFDDVSSAITSWSLKEGFGPESATSLFFEHALNGGGTPLTISPTSYPGLYVELDTSPELYKSAKAFFAHKHKANDNSFQSKAPDKSIEFKNGDLHFSINKISGGVTWSAQKDPDGSWIITGSYSELYDFDRVNLTHLAHGFGAVKDSVSRIAKMYGHELQVDGKLMQFDVNGKIYYKVLPNSNMLTPFVPPTTSQTSMPQPPSSPTPQPPPSPTPQPPPSPTPPPSSTQLAQDQALVEMVTTAVVNPNKPPPPQPPNSAQVTFLLDLADNAFYGPIKSPPAFAITNLINGANDGSVPVDVIAQVLYDIAVMFGPLGGTYGVSLAYSVGSFYSDIAGQGDDQDEGALVSDLSQWAIANVTGSLLLGQQAQQFLGGFDGPTLVAIANGGDYGESELDDLGSDITYSLFG